MAELVRDDTTLEGDHSTMDYRVVEGAILTGNNATTQQIYVQAGSGLVLNQSNVTGNDFGVRIENATATLSGSTLVGGYTGLELGATSDHPGGSSVTVNGGSISGGVIGVSVGSHSVLVTQGTKIQGDSYGLRLANGKAMVQGGSITGGNGVLINPGNDLSTPNDLTLDGTRVVGTSGSALYVDDFGLASTPAQILVSNGTTLTGANGVVLEVAGGAAADMTVDNSHLVGDVTAGQGATANLVLQNSATLTGNLNNVASLALNSNGQWIMTGDGQVARLSMDGGSVRFGQAGEFYTLSLGELSGSGTFHMEGNFAQGQHDFLDVTGMASGSHQLAVTASGADPLNDASLHMVHIAGGDAEFTLLGGPVDLGTWSYDLMRQGNDWFLDASTKTISPGTGIVLALSNAVPTAWYGELTTLRSRMGELRLDRGNAGGWIRAYGSKYDVEHRAGIGYQQSQKGLSLGADAPLPYGDGQWLVGVMAGYSQSDLDLRNSTTGTVDSYYAGAYATWLDEPSGYYFDGVVKLNRFRNEAEVAMSDGQQASGDYDTHGVGLSLEAGRHIPLDEGYFVEPFAQLAGLMAQGRDYALSNGLRAEVERSRSLLGKVGATAGRNIELSGGQVLQPYIKAALAHEFVDRNEVEVNDNVFNNDLSGSRLELGAGFAMSLSERWQAHADFDYSHGNRIEQPWGANLGIRYNW